jgi:predicted NBD/HSP70 family sugar kinase
MRAMIGVDVGATTISGGLVTYDGDILHDVQMPTRGDGLGTVVDRLLDVIDELLKVVPNHSVSLEGVGVGVAGAVDPEKGTMLRLPATGSRSWPPWSHGINAFRVARPLLYPSPSRTRDGASMRAIDVTTSGRAET